MSAFDRSRPPRIVLAAILAILTGGAAGLFADCGPFTDLSDAAFCPFVLEVFYLGVTTGTAPTTYDPGGTVTRLQMAAFLSRTVDGVLKRGGGRRALVKQFWTSQNPDVLALTTLGSTSPLLAEFDGQDVWVANGQGGSVTRVRASDGSVLGTWTGGSITYGILVAMGRIFATGQNVPGTLYRIDPSLPPGAVTTVASNLGNLSIGITFDGARIWTANAGGGASIVTPGATIPWSVTTVTAGLGSGLVGALYDGSNVWVTELSSNKLHKLDVNGAILQTVTVESGPSWPAYDGTNIWVPNVGANSVSVVKASNGAVLATLTGNGMFNPRAAAFDGLRVLVTSSGNSSVSLWKAADLTTIGNFSVGVSQFPWGACSDGSSFWVTLGISPGHLVRF